MGFELLHRRFRSWFFIVIGVWLLALVAATRGAAIATAQSATFVRKVLTPALPESPFELRFFSGAVKTNSRGDIITGPDDDPVKNLVGAESAGDRAGVERFTKILFGVDYFNGRPDPGTRLDPNNPQVNSGSQHWPFVKQPFRSWPKCARTHARWQQTVRHAAGTRRLAGLASGIRGHAHQASAALDQPERLRPASRYTTCRHCGVCAESDDLSSALCRRGEPIRQLRKHHRHG